jgi:chromosome segregation ATPase
VKANHLEQDCKRLEMDLRKIIQDSESLIQQSSHDLEKEQETLKKYNEKIKNISEQMAINRAECDRALNELNKIKGDVEMNIEKDVENCNKKKKTNANELSENQSKATDYIKSILSLVMKDYGISLDFIKKNYASILNE